MGDRLELDPDPTPPETAAVEAALVVAGLAGGAGDRRDPAWRVAGLQESVDREPQAPSPRNTRGAIRA